MLMNAERFAEKRFIEVSANNRPIRDVITDLQLAASGPDWVDPPIIISGFPFVTLTVRGRAYTETVEDWQARLRAMREELDGVIQ